MRTYIQVPYADKEEAKKFGAKWDFNKKLWYVENLEDITVFEKWFSDWKSQPVKKGNRKSNRPKKASNDYGVTTGALYKKLYSDEVPWKE